MLVCAHMHTFFLEVWVCGYVCMCVSVLCANMVIAGGNQIGCDLG